jgi:hypothetical protein
MNTTPKTSQEHLSRATRRIASVLRAAHAALAAGTELDQALWLATDQGREMDMSTAYTVVESLTSIFVYVQDVEGVRAVCIAHDDLSGLMYQTADAVWHRSTTPHAWMPFGVWAV